MSREMGRHFAPSAPGEHSAPAPASIQDNAPTVAAREGRMPYLPALDGLRAIALLSVMLFHAGFSWMRGGYLPLTSFFVLSGFLITSLLLLERGREGSVGLKAFWGRRARRLVPAALMAIGLVALYTAVVRNPIHGLRGDVFAALGWVANWRFIFEHRSYADLFGDPSPVQHFWSLAVEEQFYVVLPLLAVVCLWFARGKRWLMAVVVTVLIAASTIDMHLIFHPGQPPLRSYFGTDTRAAELFVGVLLALILCGPNGPRRLRGPTRWVIDILGSLALVVSVVLWFTTREYDDRLYEGGLLGIAILAALIVATLTQPTSPASRLLGLKPLAAFGRISYGVYLFHWPLFLWINEARSGLSGWPLFGLRMAVTVPLAGLSYKYVEQPIRLGKKIEAPPMLAGWATATVLVAALLVASVGVGDVGPTVTVRTADAAPQIIRGPHTTVGAASADASSTTTAPTSTTAGASTTAAGKVSSGGRGHPVATAPPTTAGPTTTAAPPPPLRVMVVGDSIAVNLATGLAGHIRKYGDMIELNDAADGCPGAVDGQMYWPGDNSWHSVEPSCIPLRSGWSAKVRSFRPDVVLIHSSIFDVLTRKGVDGWGDSAYYVGQAPFDSWIDSQQAQMVSDLSVTGARVVWALTPCARFDPANHPNHPDNATGNARIRLLDQHQRATGATIADLYGHLCPGGTYYDTVDGVPHGRYDGVHLTDAAATALADNWLAPLLHQIGGH